MKIFGKVIKIIFVLWLAVFFYFLGYLVGHKNLVFEKNYQPKVTNKDLGQPKEVDFSIFWDVWNTVTEKYVGEYSNQKLIYGAIKGMVDALGDPYSNFLEPDMNKLLMQDLSGQVEGIGVEISQKDGKIVVIAPLSNSPAEKVGIKAKDEIIKVNNEDIIGLEVDEVVKKIRGPAGSQVTILINRQGLDKPKEFVVTREKLTVNSVEFEMKDQIAYIKMSQFGDDTKRLMMDISEKIIAKNPKAIVLDLRDNPGGYLDVSVDVASLFMDKGVVVKEQYKNGQIEELKTTLDGDLKKYKIIVLVNEGSASASEIVAGALRDSRNATIIGKKTFGKGSVQELENLAGNAALRITVAKWLTPKGKTIDKEGITPDIVVDLTDEDQAGDRDPQLDRALEEANK